MLIAERQQKILQIVEENGGATVEDLVRTLYASAPTIRRDLSAMEQNGLLKKVYGGAIPLTAADREIPLSLRAQSQSSAKERMAERAAELVQEGMVIFMDGSSSVCSMVKYLEGKKDILVVTSSALAAVELAKANISTLCTGGKLLNHSLSFVGYKAEDFIRSIHADLLFFSCHGLSEEGQLTDLSMEEVHLRQVMLQQAKKSVLLCDQSKFGKTYFYNLCHKDEIDLIISE